MSTTAGDTGAYLAAEEAAGFGHAGWVTRKPGEPDGSLSLRNTIAYLQAGADADLDRAARLFSRIAELARLVPAEYRDTEQETRP